jgi:hypothetical protein
MQAWGRLQICAEKFNEGGVETNYPNIIIIIIIIRIRKKRRKSQNSECFVENTTKFCPEKKSLVI